MKSELLEPHCDAAVALDALEEVLYEMPLLVERAIERALFFSVRSRWNHDVAGLADELLDDEVRIVPLVGDDVRIGDAAEEPRCLRYVVDLAAGEFETNRISEGVHNSVNFCGRSSARLADRFGSVFFGAPDAS